MAGLHRWTHPLTLLWANLSLRGKGIVVIALPLFALLLSGATFFSADLREQRADEAAEHAVHVRTAARVTLVTLLDLEDSVRGYLLSGDEAFLEPAAGVRTALPEQLERLDTLVRDNGERGAAVLRIASLARRRLEIAESLIVAPPSEWTATMRQGKAIMDLLREEIDRFLVRENRRVAALQATSDRFDRATRLRVLGALVLGLLGGLAGILLFTTGVVRRVRRLHLGTRELLGGEAMEPLPVGADEIGDLGRAMEATALRLQRMQAELRRQALFDELTALRNRRGFLLVAEQQLRVARRRGDPVAVLFADLDGMKGINDTFGHDEGDRALVDTATILRSSLRAADVTARLGGDEFCALLVDCPPGMDAIVLDRLRSNIERHNETALRPYRLSLSLGLAHAEPGSPEDIDGLIRRADRSMYLDKAGRT